MKQQEITITLKLFSHIEQELNLGSYDPGKGMSIAIASGTKLKDLLKKMGLKNHATYIFFRNTEQVGPGTKLNDGDVISCLKPSGGG